MGRLPVFGRLLKVWNWTPVDRSAVGGSGAAKRVQDRIRRTGAWAVHPPLVIFSEGTCTNGSALLRFKNGPFAAAQPVQPIVLRYDAVRAPERVAAETQARVANHQLTRARPPRRARCAVAGCGGRTPPRPGRCAAGQGTSSTCCACSRGPGKW